MEVKGWDVWQLNAIDDYINGYSNFNRQQDLAQFIGKPINAVKIRLSRRRNEIEDEKRQISKDEYMYILSNRFTSKTSELANALNIPVSLLIEAMDEIDSFECKENLTKNYQKREMTNDEYNVFLRLYHKQLSKVHIAHILNRPIKFIESLVVEYERI